jgi:cell division septation protein DedD
MRNLSLIIAIFFSLILISCGPKKEKTENLENPDSSYVDETLDTTNSAGSIISDGFTTDESGIIDSSKKEPMVYNGQAKEQLVDSAVDNKTITKPVVENKTVTKPVKENKKNVTKSHQTKFYVVAGSFKKYSNAQNLFDHFKKKGYQPLILPKSKGYTRLALVSYTQETEARKALAKLRSENNDITFWLYKW